MKKRILAISLIAAVWLLTTACSRSDSENDVAASMGASAGQGTITGVDTQDGSQTNQDQEGASVSDTANSTLTNINLDNDTLVGIPNKAAADSTVGSGAGAQGTAPNSGTAVNPSSSAAANGTDTVNEANYSDDEYDTLTDGGDELPDLGWSGTYDSQDGGQLTITVDEADSLSFSFAESGIYGRAELSGNQAVYHGDDYHVIVFTRDHDVVYVSVLSDEDYDKYE